MFYFTESITLSKFDLLSGHCTLNCIYIYIGAIYKIYIDRIVNDFARCAWNYGVLVNYAISCVWSVGCSIVLCVVSCAYYPHTNDPTLFRIILQSSLVSWLLGSRKIKSTKMQNLTTIRLKYCNIWIENLCMQ